MAYTNFNIIQGDEWALTITYTDINDVPIDVSDYQLIAEVTDKPGSKNVIATSTTQNGRITSINDGTGATIKVVFPAEQTRKFVLPKSYYQIKIVDTADTLLNGWIELEASNL